MDATTAAGDDGASGARNAQLAQHTRHLQAQLYASPLETNTRQKFGRAARALPNSTPPPPPFVCGRSAQRGRGKVDTGQSICTAGVLSASPPCCPLVASHGLLETGSGGGAINN